MRTGWKRNPVWMGLWCCMAAALPAEDRQILPPLPVAIEELNTSLNETELDPLVVVPVESPEFNWPVMFEDLELLSARYGRPLSGFYIHPGSAAGPALSPAQCRWSQTVVNWRLNSMHARGCFPEGYLLSAFIEHSPAAAVHHEPLSGTAAFEPGHRPEATRTEGGLAEKSISDIRLSSAPPPGPLPGGSGSTTAESRFHLPGTTRAAYAHTKYWQASLLNHQPLYFEDVNLERHGYTWGLAQPVVSGARFFATFPQLPYLFVTQPPQEIEYTLGQHRPGSAAPYVEEFPDWNDRAALVEAGAVVGLVFLIP